MVNITDINEFHEKQKLLDYNFLKQIFEKQKQLLEKYRKIENIPRLIDINTGEHQKVLKEFTFRGIEELAEAYEGYLENDTIHFIEEISDSLHFFTEVLILAGLDESYLKSIDKTNVTWHYNFINIQQNLWEISYLFSIACNVLKNKPWAQSQFPTDEKKYKERLIKAYDRYLEILNEIGFSGRDILELYINKNSVNNFRIGSNY